MRHFRMLLVLALTAGLAHAQSAPRMRAVSPVVSPAATAAPVDPAGVSLPKDYQALYQKELEKNRQLKAEVESLSSRLREMTRPGGSLVQAYCETPVVSRNTAGARNDCSSTGYGCEPVSGLCRTTARSSDQCAAGFTYCSIHSSCVSSAAECQ